MWDSIDISPVGRQHKYPQVLRNDSIGPDTIINWGRRYEIQIWCNQFAHKGVNMSVVCNNKDIAYLVRINLFAHLTKKMVAYLQI